MEQQEQYLTVKQFAKRAGVSTQRIYQLLTKSLQEFTKTENGTKYISVEGLRVFDKEPTQEVAKDLQSDLQDLASPETELLRETIETLRQQLTVKDEQLAEQLAAKDAQIAAQEKHIENLAAMLKDAQEEHKVLTTALTNALTASQALHAGTIQEQLTSKDQTEVVDAAEAEPSKPAPASSPDPEPEPPKKRSLWQRLFHRG